MSTVGEWWPCVCGHLAVEHAADGPCKIGWLDIRQSCDCSGYQAAVA